MNNHKTRKISTWLAIALLCFFALAGVIILIILNSSEHFDISESIEQKKQDVLVCTIGAKADSPFYSPLASNVEQKIKVLFDSDDNTKIFYEYEGKFISEDEAKNSVLDMHIEYDTSLQDTNYFNVISARFMNIDNLGRIDLFMELDKLSNDVAKYFFVDEDSVLSFGSFKVDQMKKYYESKGFVCKIQ